MLKKHLKRLLIITSILLMLQLFHLKAEAYVGNGFLWNKTEISVDLNSNFDDYINDFDVKFYYKGELTNEEVKVSLDSFYYGNLSVSTKVVETKSVKMIATVKGYSSYDRRDIIVHVVDTEFPKINKIKDLDFEIGSVINYDEYFSFSDNDAIASIQYNDSAVKYTVPGVYSLNVTVSDPAGHVVSENFSVSISDKSVPDLILSNFITVEYGDLDFDITKYVKASDSYEGDLTSSVKLKGLDVYKLGDQTVTVYVSDSSGNVRSVNKVITVVDTTAPVLELSKYNDTIYLSQEAPDFRSYIKRCDDNTSQIDISLVDIDASNFLMEYGSYIITYKVRDKANNYCLRKLSINVSYKEAPIIECKDLEFEENATINLRDYIRVSDLYDTSISSDYKLYDSALDTKTSGKYEIFVEATNMAGQSTIAKFYVTIKAKDSDTKNALYDVYEYIYENKLIIILAVIVISVAVVVIIIKKKQTKNGV